MKNQKIINVDAMFNEAANQDPVLLPAGQIAILETPAGGLRMFPVRPHAAECPADKVTGMPTAIDSLLHEGGFDPAKLIPTPVVTAVTIGEHVPATAEAPAYRRATIRLANGSDVIEGTVHLSEANADYLRANLSANCGGRLKFRPGRVLLGFNQSEQGAKQLTLVLEASVQHLRSIYYTALYAAKPDQKDVKMITKTGKLTPGATYIRKNGTPVVYLGVYADEHIFLPYTWAKVFLESLNEIPQEVFEKMTDYARKFMDTITLQPSAEMFSGLNKNARRTAVDKVDDFMNPMTADQAQECLAYYVQRYANKEADAATVVPSQLFSQQCIADMIGALREHIGVYQVVNIGGELVLRDHYLSLNREQFDALMANCFIDRGGRAMRIFLRKHGKVCLLWKAPDHTFVVKTYDEPDFDKPGEWLKTRVGDDNAVYTADEIYEMEPQVLTAYGEDGTFKRCILGILEDPARRMDVTRIVDAFSA